MGNPVKMCLIKSTETHSSAGVLLIHFQFVLSKLYEILFDINRRWRICSNKRCVSALWGYQLWLQRLLQTRNARAHLSCSGKRLPAAIGRLREQPVPDTEPGNGCVLTALWVRLKLSQQMNNPYPQWICPGIFNCTKTLGLHKFILFLKCFILHFYLF